MTKHVVHKKGKIIFYKHWIAGICRKTETVCGMNSTLMAKERQSISWKQVTCKKCLNSRQGSES